MRHGDKNRASFIHQRFKAHRVVEAERAYIAGVLPVAA